ncbi:MAG: polar amino acid ABC transporter permease [Promethearchaeota archaeon Loki_b32]|nr:MAG: polar amino acid ABC transporter permease [Candidatus Lokiarchaeota archaeon Loki_b32]
MVWVNSIPKPPNLAEIGFYIFVKGLPRTLILTVLGLLGGFVIGLSLAIMRVYGGKELNWLASGYEKLFRGIPILVLIFVFAIYLTNLYEICIGDTCFGIEPQYRPLFGVFLALALRSGAYQSQIFRGALLSVNPGQEEAARALGMSRFQALRTILLPQALRLAVPSWSNEYAVVIKDSSFALTVGIVEMTNAALQISSNFVELWAVSIGVVAILYFLLTYPITRLFGERQTKKLKELGMGGG